MIADWYDPGVGGHGMGDWTRGRIYRLTPKGHKGYIVPNVESHSEDGLLQAFASPNIATRSLTISRLRAMPFLESSALILRLIKQTDNKLLQLRAASMAFPLCHDGKRARKEEVDSAYNLGQAAVDPLEPRLRIIMFHGMREVFRIKDLRKEQLFALLNLKDPTDNREYALAVRNLNPNLATEVVLKLAERYDGKDRFYLNAIGIAVGTDPERRKVILADFEKHFPEWNDRVADLVWELRPPSVMPKLGKMLTDPKLAASSRARIVDILAASDDKSAGKAMLDVLQSDVPAEVRTQVLASLKQFLPGKWSALRQDKQLEQAAKKLLEQPATRSAGLTLLALSERGELTACVVSYLVDAKQPAQVRLDAIAALGKLPSEEAVTALQAFVENEGRGTLAAAAATALREHIVERNPGPRSKLALQALQDFLSDARRDAEVRSAAAGALADTRPGSEWLLKLHADGRLPDTVKLEVARLLRNSRYQDLRNRAMVAFPPPGKIDPKKLPPIPALVQRKGNAERGKQLFAASAKNDVQCAKCHTVRGLGGSIGPDLSMIGKKASRENLIESILYPSKAIADQYLNWQITTGKGLVLNGLIVEETPQYIVLRDGNGKDTKIDKKDIEERTKSTKSLMPEDIVVYMTEDDLLDITEYMLTLKTSALTIPAWHILGPFDNGEQDAGLEKEFPPEKSIDLKAKYDGKSEKIAWRVVRPEVTGYVDLQKFFAPNFSQIVSYLYQEIESPADQDASILIGNDDAAKLWLNGAQVFKDTRHIAAIPGASEVKVKLKKGTNKLLLKITNGDGAHGFYLTLLAEQELKAREVR
jgi:putative heme-binding domain-containing protein